MNNIMELLDGGLRAAVLFCAVYPGLHGHSSVVLQRKLSQVLH